MSFQPVVPASGYAGWSFLTRTRAAQQAAFDRNPVQRRDEDYFRQKIGSVRTAADLVSDRRLMTVALGAFGLDADINARAFIEKVLSDGTLKTAALSNRLADKRYAEMSRAFGFGDYTIPRTALSDFPDAILARYRANRFEASVGEVSPDMRLALNAQRELPLIAAKAQSADTKWFTIMGSPPLRTVVQTAFGLPKSFSSVDLDQQLTVFRDRAERYLGTSDPSVLADPAKAEALVRLYLVRSQVAAGAVTSSGAAALSLLQVGQSRMAALRG